MIIRRWKIASLAVAVSFLLLSPVAFSASIAGGPPAAPQAGGVVPCAPGDDPVPAQAQRVGLVRYVDEPDAGSWSTWFAGPEDVLVSPPPATLSAETAAELAELHAIESTRTSAQVLKARSYDGVPGKFWTQLFLELIVKHSDKNGAKNPPTLSRQMGLLHAAMYDALVVTWGAKYCHDRIPPSKLDAGLRPIVGVPDAPSYPSEHAAAAGAAAVLMAYFFPPGEEPAGRFDAIAAEIAESRLWGGANYRSDIEAGLAIGYEVGRAVIEARDGDGWDAEWDGTAPEWDGAGRIHGTCNWIPTLPAYGGPLMPMWGQVQPFFMTSGSQFRPPPPPACDSPDYLAQTRDLYEASLILTDRQRAIADYWAAGQGTVTPPGQWIHLALNETIHYELGTMRQARVMAYAGLALADAAVSAWDAKFTYWSDRPIIGINRLMDPDWVPLVDTPPFPGYVSGHSTFAGAVTKTLMHFFPEDEIMLRSYATEAAMSRFYGGIHIRADNEWGLWSGEAIGDLAAARASNDGAE